MADPPIQHPPQSRTRRWLFRIVAASLPILALVAAEWVCRLFGYGGYPPAFLHVGSDGQREWYATHRPGVDSYFYQSLSMTGGMRAIAFTTPKPPDTVRIVFIGESAMQGYPQPLALSNGAFLEAMLSDLWGDQRRPEVLNLGATAMASFPDAHFLEDMLEHQPDLVVVMTGHNEFYGAYGVASLHRSGTSPAGMRAMRWLRGFGLSQWLAAALLRAPSDQQVLTQTLMERMAAGRQVPPEDALRAAAQKTLRGNLDRMVRGCVKRGVPVMLCTLPSNERGLAPIGLDAPPPLSADARARFDLLLRRAEESLGSDPAGAAEMLREALGHYDRHARANFLLGQALSALGEHEAALDRYVLARDLDAMPWRAPSAANQAVRDAAAQGAMLCDMAAAFRAESPGGAVGWELMDDHVHMTLRGQHLFARTIAEMMTRLPPPLAVDAGRLAGLPGWETYARRLGANIFDEYATASRLRKLFGIPFLKRSNPAAFERFAARCEELRAQMSESDARAAEQWHDPDLHVSNDRPITFVVGWHRMRAGDYAGAAELFAFARRCVCSVSLWRLQLDWYLLKCHRRLRAEPTEFDKMLCREAIEVGELLHRFVGFRDPLGPSYLGMAYNLAGNHRAAATYLEPVVRFARGWEGADVVQALADSLAKLGDVERARKLLLLAEQDPDMADMARAMLARLDGGTATSGSAPGG